MTEEEKLDISVDIAKKMIECGGEIFRAEEAVRRINSNCTVFALPTLITAQKGYRSVTKRIARNEENLSELCRLNAYARRLADEKAYEPQSYKGYPKVLKGISIFGATFSFCIFFGGSITDAVLSGITGLIISYAGYKKVRLPAFSSRLVDSFIAGTLALAPAFFVGGINPDRIIIGAIMLLVPGLTVANSMRDMMNGDLIAGLIETAEAIMSALSIAFGIGGATILFNRL